MQGEGLHRVLVVGRHEHHQRERLAGRLQPPQHLHAIKVGHLHIKENDVVCAGVQGGEGLGAVGGFARYGQRRKIGQQLAQQAARQGLVVDQQRADGAHAGSGVTPAAARRNGMDRRRQ